MTKKQNTNRIGELRLNRRWSQSELAERCGAHWVTISKLERGQMQLTQDWMERLGSALGVHPTEILSDPPLFRTVYVRGDIIDATTFLSWTINVSEDGENENNAIGPGEGVDDTPFSLQFGAPEPDRTAWYIVNSEIFYPFIRSGDFARFTYPAAFENDLFLGRICLIDLDYGSIKRLIGIPTRGNSTKVYDIQVYGKNILKDMEIKDLAYLSMVVSNPDIDTYEDGEPKP